jgi:hypothetical protein
MSKNVQMPFEFLENVYDLLGLLEMVEMNMEIKALHKKLSEQVEAKIEAMNRRQTFTEYKTATDGKTREARRKEYLDQAGIPEDWRTQKEITP